MKVMDWFVRVVTVAAFFVLLFGSAKWAFPTIAFSFAAFGAWALLFPQGVLGWVKTSDPAWNVNDRSIWWVPRLIGGCFVAFALLFGFIAARR
jgi:hypothetical protein